MQPSRTGLVRTEPNVHDAISLAGAAGIRAVGLVTENPPRNATELARSVERSQMNYWR
jgi:hypothetical protein